MTALFSTAEMYTAFSALGAFVGFTPATMSMSSLLEAGAGKSAAVGASMVVAPVVRARGGARSDMSLALSITPSMKAAGGCRAPIEANSLTMAVTPFNVRTGAWASLVTDVQVLHYPPTAAFSTAELAFTTAIIRVPHSMAIDLPLKALAGLRLDFTPPDLRINYNPHGPVARPHAVKSRVIMS